MTLQHLMRRDLAALAPYPPPPTIAMLEAELGRPVIKLDLNENPYGPSPRLPEALSQCNAERYPDAGCRLLRARLAEGLDVDPSRLICSVGGDEILDLLIRLFVEPGDEVIDCTPSFAMYALSTLNNRGNVVRVPRDEAFAVDVDRVREAITARSKLIFLCSPNNPTGNPTPLDDILRLLEMGPILVLDEAYAEFAGYTHVRLVEQYPNLVVMRTMSKWAALAGIRLGYAVVDPLIVTEMTKIKSPYNVGVAAQVAGIVSLEDRDYLMKNVRRIVDERERLFARLSALAYGRVYPSEANFLYWMLPFGRAQRWKDALRERGVLIRSFSDPVEALRFSVGTPEESELLLAALDDVHGELVRARDAKTPARGAAGE